jgi:hypothetical protein
MYRLFQGYKKTKDAQNSALRRKGRKFLYAFIKGESKCSNL